MLLPVVRAVVCTFVGPILLAALIAPVVGAADALVGRVRVGGGPQKDVIVWLLGVAEAAPTPRRVVLDQRNMTFLPHVLGVTVGTRVEMPNNDRVFHNVFSFKEGKRFDLGLYPVGTTKVVEFDKPGLSRIFCNIHPTLAAYVLAVESPFVAVTDAGGRFEIAGVPPGRYEYRAWRPGARPSARGAGPAEHDLHPARARRARGHPGGDAEQRPRLPQRLLVQGPVPDGAGFDDAVTYLRVRPTGTFAAGTLAGLPRFQLRFRMRID